MSVQNSTGKPRQTNEAKSDRNWPIVARFMDNSKTVQSLINFFDGNDPHTYNKPVNSQTPKLDFNPFTNALVFLTCYALPNEDDGEQIKEKYFKLHKVIGTDNGALDKAQKIIDENATWTEIKGNWRKHIGGKIDLNTSLTTILDSIITFVQPTASSGFNTFLTDIQNVISQGGLSKEEQAMGEYSVMEKIENEIEKSDKKCVIFTGAPGTGKTYCVEKYVDKKMERFKALFDRKEYFVQFHSSYDYTDFVEGLRPIKNEKGEMEFVRMDGIFKAFCRKVAEWNPWNKFRENVARKMEDFDQKPDYRGRDFYFVIDEINRADLGRVFGELMYCFEKRGKTTSTQYKNLPTYIRDKDGNPVFLEDDGCFKEGFYIPENVVIIGTMNDIDRSVETFDFALRRRFDWVEIKADEVMETSLISMLEENLQEDTASEIASQVKDHILKMNKEIKEQSGLGPEFKIGHAYFKDLKDYDVNKKYDGNLELIDRIWEHNIQPILREYMRGRQGADKFIAKCRKALGLPSENENSDG